MTEQPEAVAALSAVMISHKLALSEEARASLNAVRAAQEVARMRARRQTVQARVVFVAVAAAVALGAVTLGPHVATWRRSRAHAVAPARPPRVVAAPVAPGSTSLPSALLPASASEMSARTPEPSNPAATDYARVAAPANAAVTPAEGCDAGVVRSAPWRLSPEACARAFALDPHNAPLALAIAQAEHARGRHAEATAWAKRALGLDGRAAEAYVIVARGANAEGEREDARAAYRRYLEVAPRGWHRSEALASLRR